MSSSRSVTGTRGAKASWSTRVSTPTRRCATGASSSARHSALRPPDRERRRPAGRPRHVPRPSCPSHLDSQDVRAHPDGGTHGMRPMDQPSPNTDVIQGTLDLLILKTLSLQPMHGFGIARRAKFYALTRAGRKQLDVETADWRRRANAVARLLSAEG